MTGPQKKIKSLSELVSVLSNSVDSADEMQVGYLIGYCVVAGLSSYQPDVKHKKQEDKYVAEVRSIYDFGSVLVDALALPKNPILSDLETKMGKTLDEAKKSPRMVHSTLLKHISASINTNKSALPGIISWNGRTLVNAVRTRKPAYRENDLALQDYETISQTFVRNYRAIGERK